MQDFSKTTFFLVSNYHTYGVQHALYHFLRRKKAKEVYFLNHPLHGVATDYKTTFATKNTDKKPLIVRRKKYSEPINYIIDFFYTLKLGLQTKGRIDIFVGFNSINTVAGILLKFFGKVNYVITYSHSFKEMRYENPFLNTAYKALDSFAVRYSGSVWGLSSALSEIRKSQGIPDEKIVVAADGVDTELIKPDKYTSEHKTRLVFVGLINPINGVELVIDALPEIVKRNERVSVDIIGDGQDLEKIKEKVKKTAMDEYVRFFRIMSIEQLAKHLPQCGIGLAPYQPLPDSTLKTTDPMKTKLYMAAGLPIISTDIYATAHEIRDEDLGLLINYDTNELTRAVLTLLNEERYKRARENCLKFVLKYDWNTIFIDAFARTNLK